MAESSLSVLKGVIARLKAVTAVTDIVGTRIYTSAPQKATFPYVSIRMSSESYSTKSNSGMQHEITIQGFSRKQSLKEALQIKEAIYDALNRQESNITVVGNNLVLFQAEGVNETLREPDGVTWQSVIQFNSIVY